MIFEKLQNGDVIVELLQTSQYFADWKKQDLENLHYKSSHVLIYSEEKKDDEVNRRILHTQAGGLQEGIRSKRLVEYAKTTKELGKFYVMRLVDPEMQGKMTDVARRWDPKLTAEQSQNRTVLPTPHTFRKPEVTSVEEIEKNKAYILYRAFRAYVRNHTEYTEPDTNIKLESTPLSKKVFHVMIMLLIRIKLQ